MSIKTIKKYSVNLLLPVALVMPVLSAAQAMVTEDDLLGDIQMVHSVTHMDQTLPETPASVTIIDRRMIDASPALDVVDLLRLVPGLQTYFVNANRPGVTYHTLGTPYPRRLEVKVDGRSVYEALFSSVEWNTLGVHLDDIDHIEVVRGANTSADGSNAFLASINIITRSPLLDKGWNLRSHAGGNHIRNGSLSYAGSVGEISHRTSLSFRSNDGFDDFGDTALDDGAETITFGFKGLWTPSASDSLEFKLGMSSSNIGVGTFVSSSPGIGTDPRKIDVQYQHMQWNHLTDEGNKYEFIAYHNVLKMTDITQPVSLYGALSVFPDGHPVKTALLQLPDKVIINAESYGRSARVHTEFRAIFNQWDDFRGVTGIALRNDRVSSDTLFDGLGNVSEKTYRAYSNVEWTATDRIVLNVGVVAENDDTGTFNSYRVASNFRLAENQALRLAFNRGYRAPTLLESNQVSNVRYDENLILDMSVIADPDITREELSSSEIGYTGSFANSSITFDLRVFREELRDVIDERREQYPDVDQQINIRDNTDTISVEGVEWQAQYRPSHKVLVHANYSYVKSGGETLYRSTPNVEYRDLGGLSPGPAAGLLMSYMTDGGVSLSTMVNYQSPMTHPSGSKLEGYTRVDLKAMKKFSLNNSPAELSFIVQNAGTDYFEFYESNAFKTRYVIGLKLGFP